MYDHVDLFSGLGCWALAARANGLRTIAFCEREEWLAQGLERIWGVPCHRDIKTFPAKDYAGRVWILTGSPPCQPASCAGKRRGKADDRWLWDETIGVCEVIQPTWFIFENPPGIDGVGLDGIISDLERIGYEVTTLRIPACAVDSPQLRDRFWIVGNAKRDGHNFAKSGSDKNKSKGTLGKWDEHGEVQRTTQSGVVADCFMPGQQKRESQPGNNGQEQPAAQRDAAGGTVADGDQQREQQSHAKGCSESRQDPWIRSPGNAWSDYDWLPFNGAVYRAPVGLYELADGVVAGIPKRFRAKLISALGNCIVPQVATKIIAAIVTAERNHGLPISAENR